MGILKDLFSKIFSSKKQSVAEREEKFRELSVEQQSQIADKLMERAYDETFLEKPIEKEPYLLGYIIGKLKGKNCVPLIDIATKNGANVYDLVDKNDTISNVTIVNIACANQPELILELDDMPSLQDLITMETFIKAFVKNPEVLFSNCKVLDERVKTEGTKKDGTKSVRYSTLRTQLQRAMNLYFRPRKNLNEFDKFAQSIADRIDSKSFFEKVQSNKMTTRSTTAANETLKRNPEKGKVVPAKALHKWNNRVLYTIPNQAKKSIKKSKLNYEEYRLHLLGLLCNSSINSFTEAEKTKLVKRCVSIVPELYFELKAIDEVDYKLAARELTVQLSTYEAFKANHDEEGIKYLFESLNESEIKNVLAKSKSNRTRKANKKAKLKEVSNEEVLTLKK